MLQGCSAPTGPGCCHRLVTQVVQPELQSGVSPKDALRCAERLRQLALHLAAVLVLPLSHSLLHNQRRLLLAPLETLLQLAGTAPTGGMDTTAATGAGTASTTPSAAHATSSVAATAPDGGAATAASGQGPAAALDWLWLWDEAHLQPDQDDDSDVGDDNDEDTQLADAEDSGQEQRQQAVRTADGSRYGSWRSTGCSDQGLLWSMVVMVCGCGDHGL